MVAYTEYAGDARVRREAETLAAHLRENADDVRKGLEIMTENVLTLIRGCRQVGVDGFYVSSQGGEAFPGMMTYSTQTRPPCQTVVFPAVSRRCLPSIRIGTGTA